MKRSLAVLLAALCSAGQLAAGDFTVKPIMIQECASIGDELKFNEKPMGFAPGFKVFLMIVGSDMTAFKEDSLVINHIKTKEGKDISKSRSGKPNYAMGHFPKVAEDGKKAVFSIDSEEDVFGAAEALQIKGSITVMTSGRTDSVSTKELDFAKSESQKAGDFTVTVNPKADVNVFGGSDSSPKVKVGGPLQAISSISFIVDGKEDKGGGGWFGTKSERTYSMSSPSANKITVKISYWADIKETAVPFEVNLSRK